MKVINQKTGKIETEFYPKKMIFEINEPILEAPTKQEFKAVISIEILSNYTKDVTKKNLEDMLEKVSESILKVFN